MFSRYLIASVIILSLSSMPATAGTGDTQERLMGRAYAYMSRGESDSAIRLLTAVIQKEPNNLRARRMIVRSYLNCGLSAQAAKELDILAKVEPGNLYDLVYMAEAQFYLGNMEASIAKYERALALQPDLECAGMGLVNAYLAQGRRDLAEQLCDRMIKSAPNPSIRQKFQARMEEMHQLYSARTTSAGS